MTEINANIVLESINEKITKVLRLPTTFKDETSVALMQLRDLRNEIKLMVKVKEFYNAGKN